MTDKIADELTERVLSKLGLSTRPTADMHGLRTIYGAWCRKVPFDNVRKLIHVRSENPGPLPGDDAEDFFEHWLRHGTGGTCWSGNGALHCLLSSLGFKSSRGVATMVVHADAPPNHGTVVVDVNGARYSVDASMLFVEPLLLSAREETSSASGAWSVRCRPHDRRWSIR